jgi:hypothetical protein
MFNDFEVKLTPESNWELKYVHIYQGIFIAATENEYKKKNLKALNEKDNKFNISEMKGKDFDYFILEIKSSNYDVQIRSTSRISLEYLIFHATQLDKKDIGRPLTFYPHLSNIESPLEEKRLSDQSYRGFINLIVLALVLSHVRLMYENWVKYGLIVSPGNIFSYITEYENVHYFLSIGIIILNVILITFFLELFASRRKTQILTYSLHSVNLSALLLIPLKINDPSRPCIIVLI